jgi:ABC-type Fe3+-citrate transport system substrate-binding protein
VTRSSSFPIDHIKDERTRCQVGGGPLRISCVGISFVQMLSKGDIVPDGIVVLIAIHDRQ